MHSLNILSGLFARCFTFASTEFAAKFDSNFKLNPPLRDEKTRKILIDGLKNGIIDVVVSDHWPQNIESKECEFEVADFGMNTLESTFGMLRTITNEKLTSASATLNTPYGKVASSWLLKNNKFQLNTTIPPNTTAVITIPANVEEDLLVNGKLFNEDATLKLIKTGKTSFQLWATSGTYNFQSTFK